MASKRDFLVEIGTEELPPKSLFELAAAFAEGIGKGLNEAHVTHGAVERFATPRRLAVRVHNVAARQPDQQIRRTGPALAQSFDASGAPTRAALGFAASCGVAPESLSQIDGPKGKVLAFEATRPGQATETLLGGIVTAALDALPIAKRMRWGSGAAEFVRPAHWVVMLFGKDIVAAEILGIPAGNETRGHRFHAPGRLKLSSPARYLDVLRERGKVIADIGDRRGSIRTAVTSIAQSVGGVAVLDAALLDEVSALVEWPVAIAGRFDDQFLSLPQEVPIATMQDHQRYFPVRTADGALMPWFVAVANIESREPDKVRAGNERVIRPRLADAAFFWNTDRKQTLASRREALKAVTFQNQLGSLYDKSERVSALAVRAAEMIGGEPARAQRAAELSKCDLLTLLVSEFPELQGLMGKYYAQFDGELAEVCTALEEQYRPRFAGDGLPQTPTGTALAIADKLDTITGIFAIEQPPSGTRDPFGLRRAALGVLRIVIERKLGIDLHELIDRALRQQPVAAKPGVADDVYDYIMERLRALLLESDAGITPEMFDAVLSRRPASPLDFHARVQALQMFLQLPDAGSLAAANKRIGNLLRKTQIIDDAQVNAALLADPAERRLFEQMQAMEESTHPLLMRRDYPAALVQLASLRSAVDQFFDAVLVMAEDVSLRNNRLALLHRLRNLFLHVADLSRLPG